MATITTLRPSATSSGVGWTAQPSGTLHGVTSDDNDTTYAEWSGSGSAMILTTPIASPPTGERRHLVRIRARGEGGSAWWAVRLQTGQLVAGAAASFGAAAETLTGSWQSGAPLDGPTTLSCYVEGQNVGVRILELFLDVDTRAAPTFTPQILDGSGTPTTTITDTVTPTARVSTLNLDGLPARQYRYWVTDASSAIVWDTGVVSGPAVDRPTTPLDNGTYVLHQQVWSTLGANTAYASAIEELEFTMAVGAVPAPTPPSVTPEEPFYRVNMCAPNTTGFDDQVAWLQLQRVDCPHGGYLNLTGFSGSYAWAPDDDLLDITGDLEVTVLAQRFDNWRPQGSDQTLISKYLATGDQRSWRLGLDWDGADNGGGADEARAGRPFLAWSPDGTAASLVTAFADERAPIDALGRVHLRVFLDVDNGSGNWEVTFETLDEEEGVWRQLGEVVTGSGTTSIHAGTAELAVGADSGGTTGNFEGRIFHAQVRSGRTGPVVASPDFRGHPLGTTQFDDSQGNTWTVTGGASVYSDQRITTVAILGPLESDQCVEWLDFTVPRNEVGRSCDHQPEPCCSYYRARTVGRIDGSIMVSDWSDAFNPGIPLGVTFAWPRSAETIPPGWIRATDLDGHYVKGIPTASTQPGGVGGAATHSHTTPGHSHTVSHAHTQSEGLTGSTNESQPFGGSGVGAFTTHSHELPTTNTSTANVSSQSASPGTSAVANELDRVEVVWIASNGNPMGVPTGAVALFGDVTPAGWETYADATARFLKGAPPGSGGGATGNSTLNGHSHTVNEHTHGGTAHSHTSGPTGPREGFLFNEIGGSGNPRISNTHTHPVTVASANTAALQSASGGTSGTASPQEPPYRNLRVLRNTANPDLPLGVIAVWRGSLGTIPTGWALCDGSNGTPDLLGRYPRGATSDIGDTGGDTTAHSHTGSNHTHTTTGHSHPRSVGLASTTLEAQSGSTNFYANTHTHTISNTDSATPDVGSSGTGTLASTTAEPLHKQVAFIQLQELPQPPSEPETFCLHWPDDEHLIRTYGPNGPMYFGVCGIFEWEVERPFTAATGVMGSRFVSSAPPGGRNLRMITAVKSEAELAALQAILARPLVLISPSDSNETWAAPVAESIRVVKIGRIREVRAEFIATGPEPEPQVADVGV